MCDNEILSKTNSIILSKIYLLTVPHREKPKESLAGSRRCVLREVWKALA